MVNMLAFDKKAEDLEKLVLTVRELIAYYSEDKWNLESISRLELLHKYFEEKPVIDLACYDVSEKLNIDFLRRIRKNGYGDMLLMLLADGRMSPMEYIKPEILASELLIKPYTREELRNKVRDLLSVYCNKTADENSGNIFVIETKDGKTRIPYRQIYYFEAREKKIFARTRKLEHPFYQTLEELESRLPEEFIRCHRSYIVNWKLVEKVDFSNGEMLLADDVYVPFSRMYKAKLRALR